MECHESASGKGAANTSESQSSGDNDVFDSMAESPQGCGDVPDYLAGIDFTLDDPGGDEVFAQMRRDADTCHGGKEESVMENLLKDAADNGIEVGYVEAQLARETVTQVKALHDDEARLRQELQSLRWEEHELVLDSSRNDVLTHIDAIDDEKYRVQAHTRSMELQGRDTITRFWHKKEDELIDAVSALHQGVIKKDPDTKTWSAEWALAPQAFKLHLHSLKGVKDKLGGGQFVLHVELCETLGGRPILYVGKARREGLGNAGPAYHPGKYYTVDMGFDQVISLVCPSAALLRSHVVLVMELWRLKSGRYSPVDVPVAWGSWPLVDGAFQVQAGRFKTPFLAGSAKARSFDTFRKIASVIDSDLSEWAGNLYFTVSHDRARGKASALRMQRSSASPRMDGSVTTGASSPVKIDSSESSDSDSDGPQGPDRIVAYRTLPSQSPEEQLRKLAAERVPKVSFYEDLIPISGSSGAVRGRGGVLHPSSRGLLKQLFQKRDRSHVAQMVKGKYGVWDALHDIGTSREVDGENDVIDAGEVEFEHDVVPYRGEAEVQGRGRSCSLRDVRSLGRLASCHTAVKKLHRLSIRNDSLASLHMDTPFGASGAQPRVAGIQLLQHSASLSRRREFTKKQRAFLEKLPFIQSVLCFDTGINPTGMWDKARFIGAMVIFIFSIHVTRYTHAFGLWLYLTARDVIYSVSSWYPLLLDYENNQDSNFTPTSQVLAVCAGFLFNVGLQVIVTGTVAVIQKVFGFFPYAPSRWVLWLSVTITLDPIFTFIFDLAAHQRWRRSEFMQLYNMFERENNIGLLGLVITVVLYCKLMLISGLILYKYTVRCHLNGRIEDVYKRCLCPESSFILPHDCEVSEEEVDGIVQASQIWRSERGEVKRIVCEEAVDSELCLFRDRLWVLLHLASTQPDALPEKWLQIYLHSIILTRPKRAKCRDRLGSHRIGSDMLAYLSDNFPFLMKANDHNSDGSGDVAHQEAGARQRFLLEYYDPDFAAESASRSDVDADQQRHLLYRYFHATVEAYPVGPADKGSDGAGEECFGAWGGGGAFLRGSTEEYESAFRVWAPQRLADLVFFETPSAGRRLDLLGEYLHRGVAEDGYSPLEACYSLRGFSVSRTRFLSCAVQPVKAGFVTIYVEFPGEGESRKVHRSFVYCPTGEVVEAIPSGYSFDPSLHTADYPEYWINRLLAKYVMADEMKR